MNWLIDNEPLYQWPDPGGFDSAPNIPGGVVMNWLIDNEPLYFCFGFNLLAVCNKINPTPQGTLYPAPL